VRRERVKVVTFKIPRSELKKLDKLVEKGLFKSRSEAIRFAIRKLLGEVAW
jgi:Arc/MetJ-type ribon-helix-helix transcriptional regulator